MPSNHPTRPAQIWIVADDLTGACDAAVAFAQRGARTQVLLDNAFTHALEAEVVALSTNTRDLPPEEAIHRLQAAMSFLSSPSERTFFKKIDSVLRGNTMQEIRATLAAFPNHIAILAPAYPAQGRITRDGEVIATDLTGQRTISLLEDLRTAGIALKHIPADVRPQELAGRMRDASVFLCDATEQQHLEAIVAAAQTLDRPILWIGSAGLAHALAASTLPAHPSRLSNHRRGRLLAFIGSDHPVTLRQLDHLHARHDASIWTGKAWDEPAPIAVMKIERNLTTEAQIREAATQLAGPIACLFMTGGDTAAHVCRAIHIQALCLQQEFAPGIPQGIARGGPFAGTTVILKSGGFGEARLLTDIAQHFNPQEARP